MSSQNKVCSFCGKTGAQAKFLLVGNNVCACPDCIKMAYKYVLEQEKEYEDLEAKESMSKLKKPHEIKKFLDEYVIGQDKTKERIATAVYNHYKRIMTKDDDDVELGKSNILILGPTGSGKSYIAQTIARMLDVPISMNDCSSMSASGYVGSDVESCITRLLKAADYDVKRAEMGIVFLDEIDKIATKGENASITRDVSGECVQQELLKIIEGTVVDCNPAGGRKNPDQKTIPIDTKNILFICAGAFVGLDKIIKKKFKKTSVGFNSIIEQRNMEDIEKPLDFITPDDVKKFGMIPELVGRLPIITHTNELSNEDMKRILIEPKNSIVKQYQKLLALDGIKLTFDDDALDYIVDMTKRCDIGARGLRSVIEDVMQDLMYDLPSEKDVKEYNVTLEYVKGQLKNREAA